MSKSNCKLILNILHGLFAIHVSPLVQLPWLLYRKIKPIQIAEKGNNHKLLTSLQKNPPIKKIYGRIMTFNDHFY